MVDWKAEKLVDLKVVKLAGQKVDLMVAVLENRLVAEKAGY